ncbi:MAG TPA: endospore germination permease [Clostridiales bacterium]|nr:endospore germination permease [Clostridiales bacterium]HPP67869.1 endospore germination permease [Clostridiales bacterium]HQD72550.1 endospore germination permease [Clostridiales bacterium]
MDNKTLSLNQSICAVLLFNFGSSVIMGISTKVAQDAWISIIIATVLTIPLFMMYGRILNNFPGKNVYEISETVFGKVGGKIVSAFMVSYCIFLASLVMRNYSEFTQIGTLVETPQEPILILLVITTVYLARSGIKTVGKWSVLMLFVVISVVVLILLVSINQMELSSMLPIFEHSFSDIFWTAVRIISFPYAETVVFLCLGCCFAANESRTKIFLRSLFFGFFIFMNISIRNLTLLGQKMIELSYFPSFVTARIIEVGDFLSRIEGSISTNFLLAGIVKISICLLGAAKGLKEILNLPDFKPMVMPAALTAFALSLTNYGSTMEMFEFVAYYAYYALPFQLIIPLALLIFGEVYKRKHSPKKASAPKAIPRPAEM